MSIQWSPELLVETVRQILDTELSGYLSALATARTLTLPVPKSIDCGPPDLLGTDWEPIAIQIEASSAVADPGSTTSSGGTDRYETVSVLEIRFLASDGDFAADTSTAYYRSILTYGHAIQRCVCGILDPLWASANADAYGTLAWVWRAIPADAVAELADVDGGAWFMRYLVTIEVRHHTQRDRP